MINKAIIIGNVGKDPVIRMTQTQKQVASFSVATVEKFNGEKKTTWHNVVLWGKLAEVAEKYLKKGKLVYIEGRIENRSYDKAGQTMYISEIVGSTMQMLDKNPPGAGSAQAQANFQGGDDDDVPF